jgi:predicted transcriptional regulator
MQCNGNGLSRWGTFLVVGLVFGLFASAGCEKPKPTVGEQVGNAIDETINSTGQAATDLQKSTKQAAQDFQDKLDQASKNVSQETNDLRDAVKQAVDDHLGNQQSN